MNRFSLLRGSRARAIGFLLLCLVAVLGFASVAYASTASLPATITGYVKDAGGVGLEGVQVYVDGETSDTALWGFTQTGLTDASGKFVITDIIQGTYKMFVNQPNASSYATDYAEVNVWDVDGSNYPPTFDTRRPITGGTTVNAGVITLQRNGKVRGRAMDGATAIAGAPVEASITTAGVVYKRWAVTGADGRFEIPDATPGAWSLEYTGVGKYVPDDPVPTGSYATAGDSLTKSEPDLFSVTSGATVDRGVHEFSVGRKIESAAFESFGGGSYSVAAVGVKMYPTGAAEDWEHTYYWQLGDEGTATVYMPPGTWDLVYNDDMYNDSTIPGVTTAIGDPDYNATRALTPRSGTYALYGHISEASGEPSLTAWVSASKIDPGSPWQEYFRRVPSTDVASGNYLIRLPKVTGFSGNKMKVSWSDKATPPTLPFVHVTKEATITPPAGTSTRLDISMSRGGWIKGTVRDSVGGAVVPGVTVSVVRKAFDPSFGEIAWTGAENWWTRTRADGTYEIGGLPAGTDYKVNFYPDYNEGPEYLLPIKYRDYNRRTYKNQPLVDSLNTSVGAPVSDHSPVAVSLGGITYGIDETITPGGYVALHADGPAYPTGAVWCDVMYQYKSHWFEIDSGYTTGGTFQKIWKVLPTGHYKLDYKDYFGRGSGTWEFDLAANERKYTSVLVPAPVTFASGSGASGPSGGTRELSSGSAEDAGTRAPASVKITSGLSLFKGSFVGLIGGGSGLKNGGAGGAMLTVKTGSVPSGAPALPKYHIAQAVTVLDVKSTGTPVVGKWTLTLAYSPSVPDGEVPLIRVIHYKTGGSTEILAPIAWNLTNHTVQVQTSSLSPFRMAFRRHTVKLGTPYASSTWKRYKKYTVSGTLSPTHASGKTTAKIKVYRKNSRGHYVYYKSVSAPNYSSGKRYRATFSLKPGKYRMRAAVSKSTWHLSSSYSRYKYVTVK